MTTYCLSLTWDRNPIMHKTEIKDISHFSIEKAKGMSCYICEKCYRISKEKLVSCPKCGATSSYVLPDELGASRAGAQPTGADTGGIMPESWEDSSPPLSIISAETEKEKEKKRHKNKKVR